MKTLAVIALLSATPAIAKNQECGETVKLPPLLLQNHGETVIGQGIDTNGIMFQIFANPDTQTFTIVISSPKGVSCVFAYGDNFEVFHYVPNI